MTSNRKIRDTTASEPEPKRRGDGEFVADAARKPARSRVVFDPVPPEAA